MENVEGSKELFVDTSRTDAATALAVEPQWPCRHSKLLKPTIGVEP